MTDGGRPHDPQPPSGAPPPCRRRLTPGQQRLIAVVVVLAVVNVTYRLVATSGASRTAALFVGIPAVLAIGLALVPRSGSAVGMLLQGSTLGLLLATVILPEGLVCLVLVMPLVGLIAVVVGVPLDAARRRGRRQGPTLGLVALPLALLSLEGVVGSPVDPHAAVTATVVVDASPAQVRAALAAPPRFDRALPPLIAHGFNRPVAATGSGLDVGDGRAITFTGGDHDSHPGRLFGGTGEDTSSRTATMHLVVEEAGPGRVVFGVAHDGSMLSRWVDLERAVVTWRAVGDGRTEVTWRLEYERLLQPSLYFGPLQSLGLGQAAGYLLDAVVVDGVR